MNVVVSNLPEIDDNSTQRTILKATRDLFQGKLDVNQTEIENAEIIHTDKGNLVKVKLKSKQAENSTVKCQKATQRWGIQRSVLETRSNLRAKEKGSRTEKGTQAEKGSRRKKLEDSEGENSQRKTSTLTGDQVNARTDMNNVHNAPAPDKHRTPGNLLKKNPLKKRKLKGSKQITDEWTSQQGFGLESHQTTNIDKKVTSTAQTEVRSKNDATSQETGGKRNQPVGKGKKNWKTRDKTKQESDKDMRKKYSQSKSTISSKKLKCTFTNAQSIMSKRDDLQCYINSENQT